ncbi:MAG: nucleotidyltransferase family protein [Phycisphaerae bacterium]|nr:nucleotidyltransferase family protein [Phycisphaerae bacterium]
MITLAEIQKKRAEILKVAASYGADNLRIFGSVVRGTAGPDSDVDILVRMSSKSSLLDRIGIMQDLEALLGVKVDVVNEKAVHPLLRDRIFSEVIPL